MESNKTVSYEEFKELEELKNTVSNLLDSVTLLYNSIGNTGRNNSLLDRYYINRWGLTEIEIIKLVEKTDEYRAWDLVDRVYHKYSKDSSVSNKQRDKLWEAKGEFFNLIYWSLLSILNDLTPEINPDDEKEAIETIWNDIIDMNS